MQRDVLFRLASTETRLYIERGAFLALENRGH